MTFCLPSSGPLPSEWDIHVPDAQPHVLDVVRLTAAMARGDGTAVETFYRAYFERMYAEARRASRRDEAFCLDVVQEASLRIIRTIRPVESEMQLTSWLKLVIRTSAYDLLRSERRRRLREQSALARIEPAADDLEHIAWLEEKLRAVDPKIAELIELRFAHGWTLARIAGRLGLTTAAVDGRIRRALHSLRNAAREEWDD
jgi:RNA polymerase sigma factor (sigma-70 family)